MPHLKPYFTFLVLLFALAGRSTAQLTFTSHSIQSGDGKVKLNYRVYDNQNPAQFIPNRGFEFTSIQRGTDTFPLAASDVWSMKLREASPSSCQLGAVIPGEGSAVDGFFPSVTTTHFNFTHAKYPAVVQYTWESISPMVPPLFASQGAFNVKLTASAISETSEFPAHITLKIKVTRVSGTNTIHSVEFPRIGIQERLGGNATDQMFSVPDYSGKLYSDPIHNSEIMPLGNKFNRPHPGALSMQFFSYYNQSEGADAPLLYLASQDKVGFSKQFFYQRVPGVGETPGYLYLRLNQKLGDDLVATEFISPFLFTAAILSGDWYDAAKCYRKWATSSGIPWTAQGTMRQDSSFPQELKDARMICWTTIGVCPEQFSSFMYWSDHINEHKLFFGIDNLVTEIHAWEQKGLVGSNYGKWLPPRWQFVDELAEVNAIPGHSYVNYFNANWYTIDHTPLPFPACPPDLSPSEECALLKAVERDCLPQPANPQADHLDGTAPCGTGPVDYSSENTHYALDQRSGFVASLIRHTLTDSVPDFGKPPPQPVPQPNEPSLKQLGSHGMYLDRFSSERPFTSYNHGVSAESGLPEGGGLGDTSGRLRTMESLRSDTDLVYDDGGDPKPMYFFTEGPQEMFIEHFPLVFGPHLDMVDLRRYQGSNPLEWIIPLYSTVYHDYHLQSPATQIVTYASDIAQFEASDPNFYHARMTYAAKLFFGMALSGGSTLTPMPPTSSTSDQGINGVRALVPEYQVYTDMVRNFVALMRHDEVREFTVFGERMRDPTLSGHQSVAVTEDMWVPYGAEQPCVYAAAFRTPGPPQELGILLLNWTDEGDPTPAGEQTFSFTIDPDESGIPPNVYSLWEIVNDPSATPPAAIRISKGPVDLNAPATVNVVVPALSAAFYVIEL